jgi:ankyrin repeat domain-containing protein 50
VVIERAWKDAKHEEDRKIQQERHTENLAKLDAIKDEVSRVRGAIEDAQHDEKREKLLSWLSDVDPSFNYNKARDNHGKSTGDWLVDANDGFKNWKELPNSLLWLHGKGLRFIVILLNSY